MNTMKALVRDGYRAIDVIDLLDVRDIDVPVPKEKEVLVRVHAASVNDFDFFALRPPLPFRLVLSLMRAVSVKAPPPVAIPGCDIAGVVAAVGSRVERWRQGDAVYGDISHFGGFGGFAEYVCVPERALAAKPGRMTFEQAAALPQAGVLAAQGLLVNGPLRPGQTILINGAGGGVGTIGIQLAKVQDVEVTGVDRASKLEMMRSLGFDHVIDYEQEDFTKSGKRYDLILDTKTSRSPFEYARALNPNGTYVTVGGVGAKLLQCLLFGWWVRLTAGKKVVLIGIKQNKYLPYLSERFEAGQLVPVIDGPYTLSTAKDALRHFWSGHHKGKVIVSIGQS
jgi:NADPH:quinone reductase-like Zn-dependent oxidoreductase